MPSKDERRQVNMLLGDKDVDGAMNYINNLAVSAQDENEKKRLEDLHTYLNRNKANLLPWNERGIKLPAPPEGIVYRGLGTQEHSNCDLITHRMKRRKASWSIKGGSHMAKLLCLRATVGSIGHIYDIKIINEIQKEHGTISAAQAPKHDGKGDAGGLPHGGWPYENACLTNGRKAIRDIFRCKKQ
jgi:hypothetical protein